MFPVLAWILGFLGFHRIVENTVIPLCLKTRTFGLSLAIKRVGSVVDCVSFRSMIDDVRLDDDESKGYPILFTNQAIRKMLQLANASPRDVFYALGSGCG